MKILVAITGASGILYAQRLLNNLDPKLHELHVVLSKYAQTVVSEELPNGLRLPAGATSHSLNSMNAPFASGSNAPDAMVIIPCSMGTLGRIAGPITCPTASLQTTDAGAPCYGSTPSRDHFDPRSFGLESAIALRAGRLAGLPVPATEVAVAAAGNQEFGIRRERQEMRPKGMLP